MSRPFPRPAVLGRARGFTLVELLVVIGIIALLISILLPALSKARRSAITVKCASALRQVGMGYQLYSNDQKGFWPVAKYTPDTTYDIDGFQFTSAAPAYWFNFVAKYVNQANLGNATATGVDSDLARKGVLWGCPAWQAYVSSSGIGGVSNVQPGYGMNLWPTFTADNPATGTAFPPSTDQVVIVVGGGTTGRFLRQTQWTNAAERCLCADSRFWAAESNPVPSAANYPPAIVPQSDINNSNTYTPGISGQTMLDIYRHGTYPAHQSNQTFDPYGGSIVYNILYCDGHVTTATDGKPAYTSLRQRFPN
jgi:prepilin-type N-terminal cleavage/methylation domain-containing protein/prepilin-type processing-associated H-X9-DG protein